MPITIFQPQPNQPTGLGYQLQVSTDFIGPLPTGTFWLVQIAKDPEALGAQYNQSFTTSSKSWAAEFGDLDELRVMAQLSDFANGDTGWLVVSLRDAQNVVIETSTPVPIVLDNQTGASFLLDQRILRQMPTGGGFTADDRLVLQSVQGGVYKSFPGIPDIPLSDLVLRPPDDVLGRELIGDFTGEGFLSRQGIVPPTFGLSWDFVSYPAGYGSVDAPVDLTIPPLLKVSHRQPDRDGGHFEQVYESAQTGEWWFFNWESQSQVGYTIAPFTTVRFYWIILKGIGP